MKEEKRIVARGISVSGGTVSGRVKVVKNSMDVNKVEEGDIMVVSQSSPAFAIGVMNSAGLICQGGGVLTHICIVAKEMGIPCMARVEKAVELFQDNMNITLDADQGVIYG